MTEVHKAIESGNSRRLSRQYAKAQKKLAKLEKRANSGKKYAKRAAALGAGAALAGGIASRGTMLVSDALGKANQLTNRAGRAMSNYKGVGKFGNNVRRVGNIMKVSSSKGGAMTTALGNAAVKANEWGNKSAAIGKRIAPDVSKAYGDLAGKYASRVTNGNAYAAKAASDMARGKAKTQLNRLTNNQLLKAGAGVAAVGLGAGAAYNAYRAATTKRAARKAAEFRSAMNESFRGTQYANGGNRQGKKRRRR